MKILEWQDEYSVGVKELDAQHKSLLNVINVLIEGEQREFEKEQFSATIRSLIHYAYTHFATEERYMTQVSFPEQEQHVLEHMDFIIKVLSLALKAEEGSAENRKELLQFLKEWYSFHVLGNDRHYIPFFSQKGIR